MTISKLSNHSFKATLKGNYKDVISLSAKNGLSDKEIKIALTKIHKACPKKEDNVYLYYQDAYKVRDFLGDTCYAGKRCGVKVFKDGKIMEVNVNPRTVPSKYLLYLMALKVEKLVSGKIESDEIIKLY